MKRTILLILICSCALVAGLVPARAYDSDTHFYYCYYLARKCGFNQEEARRIAAANVAVDYSSQTEPLQSYGIAGVAVMVREYFHSLPRSTDENTDKPWTTNDYQFVKNMLMWQESWAKASNNPGMLLHYYMDMFAHRDFHSTVGHGPPPYMHKPDFISYDVAKAMRMTKGVIWILTRFKTGHFLSGDLPNGRDFSLELTKHDVDYPASTRNASEPEFKNMRNIRKDAFKVIDALVAANPVPQLLGSPDHEKAREAIQKIIDNDTFFPRGEIVPRIEGNDDPTFKVTAKGVPDLAYHFQVDHLGSSDAGVEVTTDKDKWALPSLKRH